MSQSKSMSSTKHYHDPKSFWGPAYWRMLECSAASFDPKNRQVFKMMLYSLTELLPCDECKEHYKMNLANLNIDKYLDSRENAFLLIYILHDTVNQQINLAHPENPPKKSPPFDQVKEFVFKNIGDCKACKKK